MTPVPWPLIGPPQPPCAPTAPRPAPAHTPAPARPSQPAWTPPEPGPTATPYADLTDPTAWPGLPLWLIAESSVIARLAAAGGDLHAHRTVHGGPMNPEDVPATLVDLAMATELALREQHRPEHQDLQRFRSQNPATAGMHETAVRHLLAAVLPAHERQVRERVAADIEARRCTAPADMCAACECRREDARTARGES